MVENIAESLDIAAVTMPKRRAASKVADVAKEEAVVAGDKKPAAETVNLKLKKKKASKVTRAAKEEAVIAEDKKQTVETVNLKLKKASKVPNATKEESIVAVTQNPTESVEVTVKEKKRARVEIDEIFASKKKAKKPTDQKEDKLQGNKSADGKPQKSVKKKKIQNSSGSKENDGDSRRRRTNDGLTVYSESELGINRPDAGGTKLCPFDCDCCF